MHRGKKKRAESERKQAEYVRRKRGQKRRKHIEIWG